VITPEDIRTRAQRYWNSYAYHRWLLSGEPWQTLEISFGKPSGRELLADYAAIRAALHDLQSKSKAATGYGYRIDYESVAHRQLGEQQLPCRICFETEEDFLRYTGNLKEANKFKQLAMETTTSHPELAILLHDKPRILLDNLAIWQQLLKVTDWFIAHPNPDIYIRQIDLPNIDSKFIEQHMAQLTVLLDTRLPPSAIAACEKKFELRYGLRYDQHLIRFRLLDSALALSGLTDLTLPLEDFCRVDLDVDTVYITENKINGLAFPQMARSMVIFALGYGIGSLSRADWIKSKRIVYWGDLDTHGFAILSHCRALFPQTVSILMDSATLTANRSLCVIEAATVKEMPTCLTESERATYAALSASEGINLRLEQERIPYGQLETCLALRQPERELTHQFVMATPAATFGFS
jgi:hypothetical protein